MRTPRLRPFVVIVAVLGLVAAGCGGEGDSTGGGGETGRNGELTPVSLRLDWVAQGYQAPFYAALGLGYYEDEGLDVEILDGRGTSTTIKLVANGSNTFGFGQLSEMAFAAAAHDVPLRAIAGVFQRMPDAIFARSGSGISDPADLVGKEVVSSPGDSTRNFFPALAAANGFDPKAVKFLNVSSESKTTAFIAGKGDAMLNFASEAFAVEEHGVDAEVLMYADYGVNLISQGLFAHVDYLSENPDVVSGFVRASMKGVDYAKAHPEDAAKWVLEYRPGAETLEQALFELKASLPLLETANSADHATGYMSPQDWRQSISLLQRYQGMPDIRPQAVYTNEFVED